MNQGIYKPGEEYWLNAKIPRGVDLWGTMSDGYKTAADILVKHVEETHSDQDYLVHPICYLLRHSIELYLKQIIYYGSLLLDSKERQLQTHEILNLWKEARVIIERRWSGDDKHLLEKHEMVIREVNEMDPTSQTFRYHIDAQQKSPLLPQDCTLISIKNMAVIVLKTVEFISNCSEGLLNDLEKEKYCNSFDE